MAERRTVAAGTLLLATIGLVAVAAAAPGDPVIDVAATASAPARRLGTPGGPGGPTIAGCPVFPADHAWNTDVSEHPRHPRSDEIIATIRAVGGDRFHPDFGEEPTYGIPYVVVPADQPRVGVRYTDYGDESDPGPFPIPLDAPVEGGDASTGDRHVIAVQEGTCELFELFVAVREGDGWAAASGARWDLRTGAARPIGWTSADAAGLAILPGLVRHEEVAAGEIRHALRVTFARTQRGFVLPATHFASRLTDPTLPPMGLRLRLRADHDIGQLTGQARVIATALQRYGLIVADNGSNWYVQGAPSPWWDDDDLAQLKQIPGSAFEVVDTGPVRTG